MIAERVLRGTGIVIALLGLIDPAINLPWQARPVVAIQIASGGDGDRGGAPDGNAGKARALRELAARVRTRLSREFDVRDLDNPSADAAAASTSTSDATTNACVVIGDGTYPDSLALATSLPADTPLIAVRPTASDTARGVEILNVAAPQSIHITSQLHVTVSLAARGQRGQSSTIALRANDLELARATHAWTSDDERAMVTLDAAPLRAGVTRFSIAVTPSAAGAATPATPASTSASATTTAQAARADFGVRVTSQPLRVLFIDARPSWSTRFIRLALETDTRFQVDSLAQVSRNLSTRTADAPPRVTLAAIAPFDVVIAGAPDLLSAADVEALRTFARARGGLIVFAPDRAPEGPYVSLLPADKFEERLLDEPHAVMPEAGPASGSPSSGLLSADARLLASELALPGTLHPGTSTLAAVATGGKTDAPARAVLITSPLGDGQIIYAGALDAWRYRDRDQQGFDRLWRQLIAASGTDAAAPIDITLDPLVARPGAPVSIRARWRRDLLEAAGSAPMTVHAAFGDSTANRQTPDAPGDPVRLWPGDRPGEFRGTLNAPARAGVYAVSLEADNPSTHASATALVLPDVLPAAASWDGLRAAVESRGGVAVTEDQIDRAITQLHDQLARRAGSGSASGGRSTTHAAPRHPWRSAWWIVPFAGCLGGEWLLRRRRGEA